MWVGCLDVTGWGLLMYQPWSSPFLCSRLSGTRGSVGTYRALWSGFLAGCFLPACRRPRLCPAGGFPPIPRLGGCVRALAPCLLGVPVLRLALAPHRRFFAVGCTVLGVPAQGCLWGRLFPPASPQRLSLRRIKLGPGFLPSPAVFFRGALHPGGLPLGPPFRGFGGRRSRPLCGCAPTHGFSPGWRWLGSPGPPSGRWVRRS